MFVDFSLVTFRDNSDYVAGTQHIYREIPNENYGRIT